MITIEISEWLVWAFVGMFAISSIIRAVNAYYYRKAMKLRDELLSNGILKS